MTFVNTVLLKSGITGYFYAEPKRISIFSVRHSCRKSLDQCDKDLVETEAEIDKLHGDADEIVTALVAISSDESIQNTPFE